MFVTGLRTSSIVPLLPKKEYSTYHKKLAFLRTHFVRFFNVLLLFKLHFSVFVVLLLFSAVLVEASRSQICAFLSVFFSKMPVGREGDGGIERAVRRGRREGQNDNWEPVLKQVFMGRFQGFRLSSFQLGDTVIYGTPAVPPWL